MKAHEVRQGEHLSRIAAKYGFPDYRTIWEDPANANLRNERPNPHVLYPGDLVMVPDLAEKTEPCDTTKVHRFRLFRQKLFLGLIVKDADWLPVATEPCRIEVEGLPSAATTNAAGKIKREVSATAADASLTILGIETPIRIGHLDPVEEVSGQIARLNNLGYEAGDPEEFDEIQLQYAIEEFQCDLNLPVNGTCGLETLAALKLAHGC